MANGNIWVTAWMKTMATDLGLTVEPTSIQKLVVAMSTRSSTTDRATAAVPSDLLGVPR